MKLQVDNKIFFAEVENLLAEGESVTVRVRGCSMMPHLRDGKHSVVVRRCKAEDIKLGAVMFFEYRGQWIMHRLRRIEGEKLIFAGDGNYKLEEVVGRDALRGVVTDIISPSGYKFSCESFLWRFKSGVWLMLPAIVRRYMLAIIRRLKL
jgi:hypothetical protein